MLAPPKRQSAGGSVHSEQGPAPDSAFVRRVPAQIESFRNAMSRDSSLGIPFDKFFSICGNYDSVIYGRALTRRMDIARPRQHVCFVPIVLQKSKVASVR